MSRATPGRLRWDAGAFVIRTERGEPMAMLNSIDAMHGQEIARRWNAHDDFLAACEQVVREVECHCADYPRSPVGSCPHCVCRAAVAKAGGDE